MLYEIEKTPIVVLHIAKDHPTKVLRDYLLGSIPYHTSEDLFY
jgi:hypothetical protein